MKYRNLFVMLPLLFFCWLILNASLSYEYLISGAIAAVAVGLIFISDYPVFSELKLTPKAMLSIVVYCFVFLYELVKSNFDVAKRVISPTIRINPGIVAVKTSLKSKTGRLLLANTITLTPGTFTIDIQEDVLYIHWIDVAVADIEGATKAIVEKFEKHLEAIYG